MAQLTVQKLGPNTAQADLVAALAAAAGGGDTWWLQGRELLVVNNGGGSPITVTIVSVADNFGITNAAHDLSQSVGAGKIAIIGPLATNRFQNLTTSLVSITYSGVTSVTVGVFSVATQG